MMGDDGAEVRLSLGAEDVIKGTGRRGAFGGFLEVILVYGVALLMAVSPN